MSLPKYQNKPFKPPRRLISAQANSNSPLNSTKRLPSDNFANETTSKRIKVPPSKEPVTTSNTGGDNGTKYFTIMYRKPSMKKHKTWDNDGYAQLRTSNNLILFNDAGTKIGNRHLTNDSELCDFIFKAGSWEVQVDYELSDPKELQRVRSLLCKNNQATVTPPSSARTNGNAITKSVTQNKIPVSQLFNSQTVTKFKTIMKKSDAHTPLSSSKQNEITSKKKKYQPVFDVSKIENPIIMNKWRDADVDVIVDPLLGKLLRPHQREGVKFMYDCVMGLATNHQETDEDNTGKSLILEKDSDIGGCLLADEMGLGKTLMTITLIWTLLKQSSSLKNIACSQSGVPLHGLCRKILVVCPVTLIGNWKREFAKWLNLNRIGILTLSSRNTPEMDKTAVKNFLRVQRTFQVLVIGYEKLLSVSEELHGSRDLIDLLICDEGHRLKNGSSKVLNVLKNLEIKRKILLSGTPIQNDLNEFYTIIDFLNPGILGSYPYFKKRFIAPITRGRDTENRHNEDIIELGEGRSKEMIDITRKFTLRRTNAILSKYLPPKTDIILFCKPTQSQLLAFNDILSRSRIDFANLSFNSSLGLITLFKKICNSPTLIGDDSYYQSKIRPDGVIQERYDRSLNSGKLKILMTLLEKIKGNTNNEKVVIVSNYTQTLDIIQNLMNSAQMVSCRLDGSTPAKQRDSIVNTFNRNPSIFAFLLSAKSGGVGLNLIGASRLILFDNDWNPSIDLQAMSRIHRDGQKKHCYIYRLITTGCIDEKILQRQLMKHSLSKKFLDSSYTTGKTGSNDDLFTKEDLKDLFTIMETTKSNTHDLICDCEGTGKSVSLNEIAHPKKKNLEKRRNSWTNALQLSQVMEDDEMKNMQQKTNLMKECFVGYKHIDPLKTNELADNVTSNTLKTMKEWITFAFINDEKVDSTKEDIIILD